MEEYLEILDEKGNFTDKVKEREKVHSDGDWHRVFLLYLYDIEDDNIRIYLQRRSKNKKTAPGIWDGTVAGHYRVGEKLDAIVRETYEELGINITKDDFVFLGRRINWGEDRKTRHINREFQDVFLLNYKKNLLKEVKPSYVEVDAFGYVLINDFKDLHDPRIVPIELPTVVGFEVTKNALKESQFRISCHDFWPSFDYHYLRAAILIELYEKEIKLPENPFDMNFFDLEKLLMRAS